MVMGHGQELTEDEAELYDRQIRLWGLESQKRYFISLVYRFIIIVFLSNFIELIL